MGPAVDSRSDGGLPAWTLRAPRDQRELFALLALYRPRVGLDALIDRIEGEELSSRLVYHVAHRRLPDAVEAVTGSAEDVKAQLAAAIRSAEFRDNLLLNLLHAFPELRRDVLLLLPGQTPPTRDLAGRRALMRSRLGAGTGIDDVLAVLADTIPALQAGRDVLVACPHDVERLLARADVRPQDRLMLVLDTPDAVMVDRANHAVQLLLDDPDATAPETQHLRHRLDLPAPVLKRDAAFLRQLVERVLADAVLSPPDPICTALSHLPDKTAEAALLAVAALDIELTTAPDRAAWLLERWDVVAPDPTPRPGWWLDAAEARARFAPLLDRATEQDRQFCARVAHGLHEKQRCWIGGLDLARQAPGARSPERPAWPDPVTAIGGEQVHAAAESISLSRELGDLTGLWLGFGQNGEGGSVLGEGWSVLEDHSCWTRATRAELHLPRPREAGSYRLQLDAEPFVVPGRLPRQRVGVRINGQAAAVAAVSDRFLIDVALPWAVLEPHATTTLELILPDAARPVDYTLVDDDRRLGLYVRSVALLHETVRETTSPSAPAVIRPEPSLPELALAFESLGENCELGLVQRQWGAEPLGLLRFASSPLDKLLPALRNRFREMGDAGMLEVELGSGDEYMVLDRKYGFLYHAWAKVGELTPEQILTREYRRVPFLIRKLSEDLQAGEKMFVYHGITPLIPQQVRAMSSALRLYGPGRLLWLELADEAHPPGSVEWAGPNVIKGHIDRFAPGENAHDFSLSGWEEVCRAALRLADL